MAEVWTLSEESIRKLAKLVSAQERELSNLRRHLAHYSTRRHEAVYIPSKPWKIASAQFDGTGAYNPASSGAEKVLYFSSISTTDDDATFELTSGSNKELRVNRDVTPCFIIGRLDVTVDYVRNSWSQISGVVKREIDDSGSWSSIGLGSEIYRISWPDVATISGGTAYSKSLYIHSGVQLSEGMDIRGSLEVAYGSTSPQVSAGGEIHIYYQ